MDIMELRKQLDEIDTQMAALFEERMAVCRDVAEYKIGHGKPVLDKERENQKIASVGGLASNEFNARGLKELFGQIMAISRKLQYQMLQEKGMLKHANFIPVGQLSEDRPRVVFQGTEGAYSQAAMEAYFGGETDHFHVDTFRDAMCAIEEGRADLAVLPIENSTVGIVDEIYDLLVEFENYIVGEQVIQIRNALIGLPGGTMEEIREVYSHPQALMQCAGYLRKHTAWQQIGCRNTAVAARKILEEKDVTQAAIASPYAAKLYGLEIFEEGISDAADNSTRFIIVAGRKIYREDAQKVSVCFEVPHAAGSLYHILSHFIYNGLNMTKIESRPIRDRNWEYRFFVDFEGNFSDMPVRN
ncbi:MAG TPA: bifunctional chorismate mutase/prephenate dehydratase, partial [Lachnospiraceae bacterium]|nr:bifunctional chorismate mutase/prephenate dehydratase [Lachnospiraceae bacterium]